MEGSASEYVIFDAVNLFNSEDFRRGMSPDLTEYDVAVEASATAIQCSDELPLPRIEATAEVVLKIINDMKRK